MKFLRVPVLDVLPNVTGSQRTFTHWERMLSSLLTAVLANRPAESTVPQTDKLAVLSGYVSPDVFAYIEDKDNYDDAMEKLRDLYKDKKNEVYARHSLATRTQEPDESVSEFSQSLLTLA